MRRREFFSLLGGAASAWPLAARAQQASMPVIGFLNPGSLDTRRDLVTAFHRGLAEAGYIEGKNVGIEYRWAEGQNDRLPALAADLVQHRVAVIVAVDGTAAAVAAKAATSTIPIVFMVGADPVELGFVESLGRPGGNMTGVSALAVGTVAKRLQLMHELMPTAAEIAFLRNPTNPNFSALETRELQGAAVVLGLRLLILNASSASEIEEAFANIVVQRVGALLLGTDPFFISGHDQLVTLADRYKIPAIYPFREDVVAGGLMSYGSHNRDSYRLVGGYAGRILGGKQPADLPVEQVTKIEMVLNLKTAKTLGITFPTSLLVRADDVIE
jgi:putative tryptophan/tyrosine transport system substrate-binding protein